MSALTITDLGISLQSFNELRADLKKEWESTFGSAIDLSPTSVDGHHIDLECKTITSISQLLEAVVANFDPDKAGGVWLDILGDYKSMSRIKATYSVATVTFSGNSGVTVPTGTIVRYDGAPCDFVLQENVTIAENGKAEGHCKANAIGYVEIFVGDWKMVSTTPQNVTCKVTQANAGGSGLNDETDEEFRARQKKYAGKGLATYDKMYAYMSGVVGEGNFSLEVNDEDVTVKDIPPHRFEFVFNNGVGDNDALAQAIWNCKPAGIKPYGINSGECTDVAGMKHTMYFSRPVVAKLWLTVEFTEDDEESLPDNYEDAIRKAVADFAAREYAPGKDVKPKKIGGAIYDAVPGILDIDVYACVSATEPSASEYTDSPIEIYPKYVATVQQVLVTKNDE